MPHVQQNFSSGDLLADRRADYAEMLFASGETAAAAEVLLGALELAPAWAMGWFRLGEMHEAAGALTQAGYAWRMALKLDPPDRAGAALKLALAGAAPAPSAPPAAFVETLFDQYAETFDAALVEKLGYRVPELLARAIEAAAPRRRFALAADLGCGTGLMGQRLRPLCERLVGYDISAGMLRKAGARGVYNRLARADLQALVLEGEAADLVAAADVLMYLGALERLFGSVRAMLAPGGLFAFSVEKLDGEGDFALRETRRYAHSQAYLRRVLAAAGLELLSLEEAEIRHDRGEPVVGLIAIAVG